jgi:hypothetical protein
MGSEGFEAQPEDEQSNGCDFLSREQIMSETQRQNQTQTGTGQYSQTGSSTSTNTPAANTPDINRLRDQQFQVDPSIGYRVGGAIRRMQSSFNNPLGGYATPAMKDAIMRTNERQLLESGSQAMREGQQDVNQMDYSRNALLAGLTQPTTQTGQSNQSGTSSQTGNITGSTSQPLLGSIIGSAAGVGAAAL